MKNWTKKTQLIVSGFYSFLFLLTLGILLPSKVDAMEQIKYLVTFKSKKSGCMARVNDFPVFNNFSYTSGSVSTGFNITPYLVNGSNRVELMMGPIDPDDSETLYSDSECELIITKDTSSSSEKVTAVLLKVNEQRSIYSSNSSNFAGSKSESRIDETQSTDDKEQNLYRVSRQVIMRDIPDWIWVNATPVTEKAIPRIYDVYQSIWQVMYKRDLSALKHMTRISNSEIGKAEGLSPDSIFSSYDLPEHISNIDLKPINFSLKDYKLKTYYNGRVFRLVDGIYENSPLRLKNKEGEIVYSYNPYFSIIDGRIVIVR